MIEHPYHCPYCDVTLVALIDPSMRQQEYIEDCEVCCQPIQIAYLLEEGELVEFSAIGIEQ